MFEFVPLAHFQLKTQLSEEQVMRLLGKPNEFSACMTRLPSTLAKDNKLSIKACSRFFDDFKQINEQLDQELEFFLLKKTKLYVFCHGLIEYLRYLLEEDLVDRTEEDKLTPIDNVHIVQGYYSSRSQR